MDFTEAYNLLNHDNVAAVATEMADWHPAILGNMLMAVEAAKIIRYKSYHPDYHTPLKACFELEPGPGNDSGRTSLNISLAHIKTTVRQLQQP